MRKLMAIAMGTMLAMSLFAGAPSRGWADSFGQSDHVDMDLSTTLGDGAAYCGAGKNAEPWILHVAVTNNGSAVGTLRIEVMDGTGTNFLIPAQSSYSLTQAFGGVTGIDQIVRISAPNDDDLEGVASALARDGAQDPFDGDGKKDNFCFSPGEGVAGISTKLAVPDGWVADGAGANGGILVP